MIFQNIIFTSGSGNTDTKKTYSRKIRHTPFLSVRMSASPAFTTDLYFTCFFTLSRIYSS